MQTNEDDLRESSALWSGLATPWGATGAEATKGESVAEQLARAAAEAEEENFLRGMAYEESSGLYYDYESGYYYDAARRLYYDGATGDYYEYDYDKKEYRVIKRVEKKKRRKKDEDEDEEGECDSKSEEEQEEVYEVASSRPPHCIRLMVTRCEVDPDSVGSLHLVTPAGGTLGREDGQNSASSHAVLLSSEPGCSR